MATSAPVSPLPTLLDLRLALRVLARRPVYALAAAGTLALGIAVSAVAVAVVWQTVVQPLPLDAASRLVTMDVAATTGFQISLSVPNYMDWRERQRSFEAFAASAGWNVFAGADAGAPAEVLDAELVVGDFFSTVGLEAAHGRTFVNAETLPGQDPVVVLGHGLWARRFGADPGVVGKAMRLDGRPYTIAGILPAGRGFPDPNTEIYLPMGAIAADLPWDDRASSFGLRPWARLRPGATLAAAQADLDRVGREVEQLTGKKEARPVVRSLQEYFTGELRRPFALLAAAGLCLFAIAVGNASNLALTRAEERRAEMGIRLALGADQASFARLLLSEALVLVGAATAAGLGLAALLLRVAGGWIGALAPRLIAARIGLLAPAPLAASAALAVLALALLVALPWWRLRADERGATAARGARLRSDRPVRLRSIGGLRGLLITGQIALTLSLLAAATLLFSSRARLLGVEKGFHPTGVFSARISAPEDFADAVAWRGKYERLIEGASALSGVRSAAAALLVPLAQRSWELRTWPGDRPIDPERRDSTLFNVVSDRYFETIGAEIVGGRGFLPTDRAGAEPVAVIDESMARRHWPDPDPMNAIGRRLWIERGHTKDGSINAESFLIVGVVRNMRHYRLEEPSRVQAWLPMAQSTRFGLGLSLLLRASSDREAAALAGPLRAMVREVDPELAVRAPALLNSYVDLAIAPLRVSGAWARLLAVLGLVLAAAGVFAVTSFVAAQRRAEIGVRLALGATRGRLVAGMLRASGLQVLAGFVLAVALSALAAPPLRSLLFGIGPWHPAEWGAAALVVLAATTLAAALPAWRAARLDPARVLSVESRLTPM